MVIAWCQLKWFSLGIARPQVTVTASLLNESHSFALEVCTVVHQARDLCASFLVGFVVGFVFDFGANQQGHSGEKEGASCVIDDVNLGGIEPGRECGEWQV
jgi:hypothetical protein